LVSSLARAWLDLVLDAVPEDRMKAPLPWLLAMLALAASPAGSAAQHVSVDLGIWQGPLYGRIIVGQPYFHHRPYYVAHPYYHPRVVIVEPRVIVVKTFHRGHGWYRHHGYRRVTVWYDRDRDRWYDRYDRRFPGLREVVAYEREGRYYWPGEAGDD